MRIPPPPPATTYRIEVFVDGIGKTHHIVSVRKKAFASRGQFSFRYWPKTKIQRFNEKTFLMKLWGDDSFFNSGNPDVYITKLCD